MSSEPWLVFDVSALAYRAYHTLRDLSYEGIPTAITYGILRDVLSLRDRFGSNSFVFTFDRGKSKRCELSPEYKSQRKKQIEDDPEQIAIRKSIRQQIRTFHDEILPALGYANIVSQQGYEADDLMASLIFQYPQQKIILVGSDHDLFQLLSDNVSMWSIAKKKLLNGMTFRREWGISPSQWADVLAIAGCSTDNVKGVKGVGPKTAVKFLAGSLQKGAIFDRIVQSSSLWRDNLKLVQLPFAGTKPVEFKQDIVTGKRFNRVLKDLGIRSLRY